MSSRMILCAMFIIATSALLTAQQDDLGGRAHQLEHQRRNRAWRPENGVIISWLAKSAEPALNQIQIFDRQGATLASVRVLAAVKDAESVGIYDVSARPNEMIAVAAVYVGKRRLGSAASLLLFDFRGKLLSAYALAPSREIYRLSLDDDLNVWTLTTGSGSEDPWQAPMVVEYGRTGTEKRSLLRRGAFPLHAKSIEENSKIGGVFSGYEWGVFWFWLPGSTDLVTIETVDGKSSVRKTGLPSGLITPLHIARQASGTLLAEVREQDQQTGTPRRSYYSWSPSDGTWVSVSPQCRGEYRLIGADHGQDVFVNPDQSFCTSPNHE